MTLHLIRIIWFTATNHYMRGLTWGVDIWKGLPKWVRDITGKYAAAFYSGLLFLPDYWKAAVIAGGLAIGYARGAEFDILHKGSWEEFGDATSRGLHFLPLFAVLGVYLDNVWVANLAGGLCAFSYALTSLVVRPFYDKEAIWAEAVSQTLFGLCVGGCLWLAM